MIYRFLISSFKVFQNNGNKNKLTFCLFNPIFLVKFFQTKTTLPSNFNEVAIILLQVLNNVARLDLSLIQNKLVYIYNYFK